MGLSSSSARRRSARIRPNAGQAFRGGRGTRRVGESCHERYPELLLHGRRSSHGLRLQKTSVCCPRASINAFHVRAESGNDCRFSLLLSPDSGSLGVRDYDRTYPCGATVGRVGGAQQ
jgi:hypothetical protein